jgi:hypothetical protein
MGERRLCKPEVTGSIPVRSMSERPCKTGAFRLPRGLASALLERSWKALWNGAAQERAEARESHDPKPGLSGLVATRRHSGALSWLAFAMR